MSFILWIISISFNDIEDALQYHYDTSIFDWIPKDSWWSWYMLDPDNTWQRKYNRVINDAYNDYIYFRKKWYGIPIPAFIFDGWHGAKFIRQCFQYMTWFAGVLIGYFLFSYYWFIFFVLSAILFSAGSYFTHDIVFNGILKKDWWIKRGKEEKIKRFLDKYF